MRLVTKVLAALALLALLLAPATPAFALGLDDGGPFIFGGNYILESGKTLDGDLFVFGGNVNIQEDAVVKGTIFVLGGNVVMDGTMDSDLVILGGAGSLGGKSLVKGDVITIGGSLTRETGSRVEGEVRNQQSLNVPRQPSTPVPPQTSQAPATPNVAGLLDPLWQTLRMLVIAVVMGGLSMLLTLFMKPQMERVAHTGIRQPLVALGMGLITVLVIGFATLVLLITVIAPLALTALLFAIWIFGLAAFGAEVGERFTQAIDQSWPPVVTNGLGTFMTILFVGGLGTIPCLGGLIWIAVSTFAVGAVTLAWLDMRKTPPATAAPASGAGEALPPAS